MGTVLDDQLFGVHAFGILGLGVCFAQKSYKNDSESNRIFGRSPGRGFLILGTLRVEINQKLSSKLIALRAEIDS